uniref:Bulb-type lectin domain-containing protein n=1 Tax=Plectus sambesii TaxID=2011161 RepID=A0A914XEY9_9BILA
MVKRQASAQGASFQLVNRKKGFWPVNRIQKILQKTRSEIFCEYGSLSSSSSTIAPTPQLHSTSSAQSIPSQLIGHAELKENDYLLSNNGGYRAYMQGDGNFVLYVGPLSKSNALWSSKTAGRGYPPYRLWVQGDNNLVVYDVHSKALWSSGTAGKGTKPARLIMQDDGNLVLYDASSRALWSSKTARS